jgi:Lrp/AsnC family transcriptional regulator for asnA, asnC and gidA
MPTKLDAIDRQIISLLQENGRRSNADISRTVGLSESSVKIRVDRLINNNVIKVSAVLNPEAVGLKANALIGVCVLPGKADYVGEKLSVINEVLYISFITGRYDLLIEVLLRDPSELYDFISTHVHKIPGIVSIETYYVMRTHKFDYEWKLPEELKKG